MDILIWEMDYTHKNYPIRKLTFIFSDWYRFNILQRIHQNYIENINLYSIAVVSAGLVKANYGVYVGLGYFIGRYNMSYLD